MSRLSASNVRALVPVQRPENGDDAQSLRIVDHAFFTMLQSAHRMTSNDRQCSNCIKSECQNSVASYIFSAEEDQHSHGSRKSRHPIFKGQLEMWKRFVRNQRIDSTFDCPLLVCTHSCICVQPIFGSLTAAGR